MPSPQNKSTLAILLGASSWSDPQDFIGSQAFANAARDIELYLLDSVLFGLPEENLLNLFDTNLETGGIIDKMVNWTRERLVKLEESKVPAKTLLFYFVGHADFAEYGTKHCLAVRSTKRYTLEVSGIPTKTLLRCLTNAAPHLSQILIFDCYYAASAYQKQAVETTGATQRVLQEAVDEKANNSGVGTYFLCSSGKNVESFIAHDGCYPLFSKALLQVLQIGNAHFPNQPYLSIAQIAHFTEKALHEMPEQNIRIPEYGSIERHRGDIANVPFFPNPWTEGALRRYVDNFLVALPDKEKVLAKTILKALAQPEKRKQQVSNRVLAKRIGVQQEQIENVLARLVDAHLLRRTIGEDGFFYALAHEYLITVIGTWTEPAYLGFDEIKRLFRHVAIDWQLHHVHTPMDRLGILYPYRNQFTDASGEDWASLLRSAFVENFAVADWIKAVSELEKPALFKAITNLFITPLERENGRVRMRAARALGQLGGAQAMEPLLAALHDSDAEVRESAAEILGQLQDARAVEPLLAALHDSNEKVRESVGETLSNLRDTYVVEPLLAAFYTAFYDRNLEVLKSAESIARSLQDTYAVEPLIATLKDPDREVRKLEISGKVRDYRYYEYSDIPCIVTTEDHGLRITAVGFFEGKGFRAVGVSVVIYEGTPLTFQKFCSWVCGVLGILRWPRKDFL